MIDSHCHLDHEPLFRNINEVINNAKKSGVKKLLTISTTLESYERILKILSIDPMIYGTIGIHPHETNKNKIDKNFFIKNIKLHDKIIGVGETGLDFYYNNSDKESQINSFIKHIEISIETKVPVIVHSRNAEKKTFEILNSYKNQEPKILMHCFTGSSDLFKKLDTLNSYFSASGIITFKNSNELQDVFKKIPLSKLLIETDSPYLAPVPMRGKKNEPSFLKYTFLKLCELKNTSENDLKNIITENFESLFFKKN